MKAILYSLSRVYLVSLGQLTDSCEVAIADAAVKVMKRWF